MSDFRKCCELILSAKILELSDLVNGLVSKLWQISFAVDQQKSFPLPDTLSSLFYSESLKTLAGTKQSF